MTRPQRAKKGVLHHVFSVLTDIPGGNRAQLSPGLFVEVYDGVFQGASEDLLSGLWFRFHDVREER
jgi:hypothetical protein